VAAPDYYAVLGVPRDADARAIRDAFRTLALRWHPDRSQEPHAEATFKAVSEAYAVLSDPVKRAAYDRSRARPADLPDVGDLFSGFGFEGGIFDALFGRRPGAPTRGHDVETHLEVALERVAMGGEETVAIPRIVPCPTCAGSGAAPGTRPRTCDMCGGTGTRTARRATLGVQIRQVGACPACAGNGTVIDHPCAACGGTGSVERTEDVPVRIPPGIEEGAVLRVRGGGLSSPDGGRPGDLDVIVQTAPHPHFTRRGADLWHAVTIDVADAALGTRLTVPRLRGPALTVEVPAGTQPGTVLPVPREGLPRFGARGHGDLFVRVNVRVPTQLDREARALYRRLRALAKQVA
jgi:molecular chaperone DnaJ